MAKLDLLYEDWIPVAVELSALDLFIVTQAIARYLMELNTIVPMKGAITRIANTYYRALKAADFEIPKEIEELWADLGICHDPESDPAVLII